MAMAYNEEGNYFLKLMTNHGRVQQYFQLLKHWLRMVVEIKIKAAQRLYSSALLFSYCLNFETLFKAKLHLSVLFTISMIPSASAGSSKLHVININALHVSL